MGKVGAWVWCGMLVLSRLGGSQSEGSATNGVGASVWPLPELRPMPFLGSCSSSYLVCHS